MEETLEILQENLAQALLDTAYMVVISAIIGVVLGTLIALLLYLTESRLFNPNRVVNTIVGFIVNAIRSLPFLILMVVLIPVAQLLLGTIGAGGIGDMAIQYGYNRYETGVLVAIVIILIVIVQIIQWIGDAIARKVTH